MAYLAFKPMNTHLLLRNRTHPISMTRRTSTFASALLFALLAATAWAAAQSPQVIPAVGSYKASGQTGSRDYTVRAQVKRRGGRKLIASQVKDACGGLATFAPTVISRAANGAPVFSAHVGGAAINGRWATSTKIEGRVRTPCAASQNYVIRLVE